jgi:hypothetical protein
MTEIFRQKCPVHIPNWRILPLMPAHTHLSTKNEHHTDTPLNIKQNWNRPQQRASKPVSHYIKSYQAAINSLFLITCPLTPESSQIIYSTHLYRDGRAARKQFDSYHPSAKIMITS